MSAKRLIGESSLSPSCRKAVLTALAWWSLIVSSVPCVAQSADGSVLYRLNSNSIFQRGCFAPCECPVMITEPVKGTFVLTPSGSNDFFSTYAVTDVRWSVPNNGSNSTVTGSGTYKTGGEFSSQQELSLYLQLDGGDVQHFDSGVVSNSVAFPDINVAISTNGQFCFDTVFTVDASPTAVPQLRLEVTSTNTVVLSWPISSEPFVLQESSDLMAANWLTVSKAPTAIAQQNQLVLPVESGGRCYRLQPSGN